ncbi:hypothetical protein MKQ70_06445 [Chitinophaga sedimenti]|uniref:hypothetical protein n=1 Tax=Chitinophaga sedimenti TaxID=2033606 RepID=UPI0020032E95|nr:hypothetical protein [Chitinophaga sedimenti]MCK7554662.1 hypothetical protein [Chitinophaga sedimenti]
MYGRGLYPDKNTITELIKPVMQEKNKRVIATGATLRIANSCDFDAGLMVRMRPPKQLLPRFREVEYIRAFVLGKMGWSLLNCVPNVSGDWVCSIKKWPSVAVDMTTLLLGRYGADDPYVPVRAR